MLDTFAVGVSSRAALRLGQWDVLEGTAGHVVDHMDLLDSDERWEVRLGKMLAAVHTR